MNMWAQLGILTITVSLSHFTYAQDNVSARIDRAFVSGDTIITSMPASKTPPGKVLQDSDNASVTCSPVEVEKVRGLIRDIAASEQFDPLLAEAVAYAESGAGNNPGISKSGALGIMQLMPGTAAEMGVGDRCNTEANIRGGIRYLKKMFNEFGDPLLMLAAYNAGPQRVYEASGIPLNSETVSYVAKVLNHWKYTGGLKGKGRSFATKGQPTEEVSNSDETEWREGHVIDFY